MRYCPSYYIAPGIRHIKGITHPIQISGIVNMVCEAYDVNPADLAARTKEKEIVFARHLVMYLIYKYSNLSLASIGTLFNRDHTSVLHAKQMIKNYLETNSLNKRGEIQEFINRCEYRDL